MLKTIATCIGALLLSSQAFGQQDAGTMELTPQETPRLKRNSVELKPGELLFSAIPGVAAAGATFESYVTRNWAGVISGSYADVDLTGELVDDARAETDEPLVTAGYGYSAGVGIRYYEDPVGDSTYGGGQIDYSELKATWDYEDQTYKSTQYGVMPSLVVGYRWVWQNGLLVRLGAGAGIPKLDSLNVSGPLAQAAEGGPEDIEDILDQQVVPKFDLGFGFNF